MRDFGNWVNDMRKELIEWKEWRDYRERADHELGGGFDRDKDRSNSAGERQEQMDRGGQKLG
jgi:hypothetical protein